MVGAEAALFDGYRAGAVVASGGVEVRQAIGMRQAILLVLKHLFGQFGGFGLDGKAVGASFGFGIVGRLAAGIQQAQRCGNCGKGGSLHLAGENRD